MRVALLRALDMKRWKPCTPICQDLTQILTVTVEGSGDRVLVIPKTKSTGPRMGCLATLTVFAKGVRGRLRPGRWWKHATSGGQRDRTLSSACGNTVLPVPSQKALGHGKDKTWKNVKCGDSTLAV